MSAELGTDGLRWADMLMEATFFIMQTYLTDVWKLSFTSAATFLNIWGGISKILPIFFLFLADTLLGNFLTLALSGVLSTTGLVLITATTWPGYRCQDKEDDDTSCVGHKEKVLFITGMGLIALGRAARSASSQSFMEDQSSKNSGPSRFFVAIFFITPAIGFFIFPYVKKWYILFGVSAICTALATLFFLSCFCTYKIAGPRRDGSPLTDFCRVFIAAAFNISQPSPENDSAELHRVEGEEFQDLSSSRIFGFLHKAALIRGSEKKKKERSWRVCSVSEVESAKILIRMGLVSSSFLMCGVVSSTADTYFVEQATNLSTNIGPWKAPLQLFLLILMFYKFIFTAGMEAGLAEDNDELNPVMTGVVGTLFAVVYCTVAAAVERRRLHVVRRHDLVDSPDAKTPMSVAWLVFQALFMWVVGVIGTTGVSKFHEVEGPVSMKRYGECLSEGVSGVGYLCGALLVYVVGKISETGGGKGWFQHTLNMSRLDRYYWVLAALGAVYLFVSFFVVCLYTSKKELKPQKQRHTHDHELA